MAASQNKADFEAGNATFVESFDKGDLPLPPARKALVLACMDARLHPEKALGIDIGDAHVVRNAGTACLENCSLVHACGVQIESNPIH
jgi:carbonic anhydrase